MFLENIAKVILNYNYNQASIESINVVKAAFIDFLGVTYRGSSENAPNIAFNSISEMFSKNLDSELSASVIGQKLKINFLYAAFLNGISAHTLELDDGHRTAQLHLGAIIFPTALAIAESYNLSGKDFIEGVIVGYEVGILLGKIVNPQHRNNGFHTTGTIGTFIAGVVASKLLNLNSEQIINTLALCGTQAAGLLESDHGGSMGKVLHVGKAIYNGLLSAYMSKNGFTGASTIFEGDEGFLKTMVYENVEYTHEDFLIEDVLDEVGTVRIRDIYFKKHPFCRHIHSSIDTALKLKASIGNEYRHINNIAIKTYKVAAEHDNFHPENLEELKQSLPYAVAITLVVGEVSVDDIYQLIDYGLFDNYSTVGVVNDIKDLADKIMIIADEKLEELYPNRRPSNVIIKLDENFRNGVFQNITLLPKGDYENPYELKEIIDKFKDLNPDYDIQKLLIIDSLENYTIKQVMNRLNG